MLRLSLLLVALSLLLGSPTGLRAQDVFETDPLEDPLLPHPLDAKDLARAKFEAYRADPKQLAQAKVVAARLSNEERYQQLLDGRATIPWLLASASRLLEAEVAVYTSRPDRLAALERHWVQLHDIEDIIRDLDESGRVSRKELEECTAARCEAEMRWAQARAGQAPDATSMVPGARKEANPLGRQTLAKAKWAAYRADPRELVRNRISALQMACMLRLRQFMAGRGNPIATRNDLAQLTEMELAQTKDSAERLAVLKTLWAQAWLIEYIDKVQHDAGRIGTREYADARRVRLDAEIRWAEANVQHPKAAQAPAPQYFLIPSLDEDTNPFADDDLRDHWIALCKARAEAPGRNIGEMRRAEYEAARTGYVTDARPSVRCALGPLWDSTPHLLDAELALYNRQADRIAVLDRHWARVWLMEETNAAYYQAGRIMIRDYTDARYDRLDAEIRLLQVLGKKPR